MQANTALSQRLLFDPKFYPRFCLTRYRSSRIWQGHDRNNRNLPNSVFNIIYPIYLELFSTTYTDVVFERTFSEASNAR